MAPADGAGAAGSLSEGTTSKLTPVPQAAVRPPPAAAEAAVLRSLAPLHTPATLSAADAAALRAALDTYVTSLGLRLHLAVLETCPFFAACRGDRAAQALHNRVLVVVEAPTDALAFTVPEVRQVLDAFDHDRVDVREIRWFLDELGLGAWHRADDGWIRRRRKAGS